MDPIESSTPPSKPALSRWAIAGLSCGLLISICLILLFIVAPYLVGVSYRRVKTSEFETNPAKNTAMIGVYANPTLELVTTNDATKEITFHDKRSGEVVTISYEDFNQGKYHPASAEGEETTGAKRVEPAAKPSNEKPLPDNDLAAMTPPSWVPSYPAALTKASGTREETQDGLHGNWQAQIKDPTDKIKDYYESTLQADGFTVDTSTTTADGSDSIVIKAASSNGKRKMTISVASASGATSVTIDYESAK